MTNTFKIALLFSLALLTACQDKEATNPKLKYAFTFQDGANPYLDVALRYLPTQAARQF